MQCVRLADAKPYDAPKHVGVDSLRLQGGDATAGAFCSVGLSRYQPGARAELDAGVQPKIYVVLSGELVVTAGGERKVLAAFDSCLIAANEPREVENDSPAEAVMLVIMPGAPA